MASVSETGHAKNVANFKHLIDICTSLGAAYQPSSPALQLTALNTLYLQAGKNMEDLAKAKAAGIKAVAAKQQQFKPFSKLITRVNNGFAACGASDGEVKNAATLGKKITGAVPPAKKEKIAEGEAATVSQSQFSEDMRLDNFEKLIEILAASAQYQPNEEELTVTRLTALLTSLREQVGAVDAANTQVIKSKEQRDKSFYTPKKGLVAVALDAKKYLLSSLGTGSAIYKKVNSLNFKTS